MSLVGQFERRDAVDRVYVIPLQTTTRLVILCVLIKVVSKRMCGNLGEMMDIEQLEHIQWDPKSN